MTNRSAQVNCYTFGNITANAESNNKAMVGGLTGMSGGTNINCYTYGNVESLITTVDVGGINGRNAGISLDYECYYNGSAVYKTAGKEITEKSASGTVVGGELKTSSKTAAEMASDEFTEALNANKENMPKILEDVSAYLDDMMSNNKEGLSHLLFYTNDGTDLNSWSKGDKSPEFASENSNTETVDPETGKDVNSANEAGDLPQTGINSMYKLFTILGAFMMIVIGAFAVKSSGAVRRREDEN
ncbi:MAG: LPXTG cell wall anchor domain-containing protein [Ruminococcus sp.]|uniref:LPXTG cell wall anchor domain-containing protein n=1 Tax=Ruminococcus sp. TaxID=41978 RepID=UPI0025FE8621|nr:LPXTG cell wall anchor domain-containing protein [Ruminococcus sp.]MCR4794329.1 LPXTG cell wall anchor domain-containing protein [Ruminococcus sp.]